mmetsp:Transcript_90316/g.255383  ORF Transcript_90316/g.255383 Transcript_90316/m.255383 type:complete len:217 (+) Transcript_90316:236-886(+)
MRPVMPLRHWSRQLSALVRGHHVLDVDESVFAASGLEHLERLRYQIADVHAFALGVIHGVADVLVLRLVDIEYREDLPVVRHEGLPYHVAALHQGLEDLEHNTYDVLIAAAQRGLDRNDQLRDDRQDFGAALIKQVVDALHRQKAVGVLLLAEAVEEEGEVVVVVQLLHVDLPGDLAARASVVDLQRHVPAVVETPEFGRRDGAPLGGPCPRRALG